MSLHFVSSILIEQSYLLRATINRQKFIIPSHYSKKYLCMYVYLLNLPRLSAYKINIILIQIYAQLCFINIKYIWRQEGI